MSEPFLLLGQGDRTDAYVAASVDTGLPTKILEKDVWICWALDVLYGQTDHCPMVFKGGTSASSTGQCTRRQRSALLRSPTRTCAEVGD